MCSAQSCPDWTVLASSRRFHVDLAGVHGVYGARLLWAPESEHMFSMYKVGTDV